MAELSREKMLSFLRSSLQDGPQYGNVYFGKYPFLNHKDFMENLENGNLVPLSDSHGETGPSVYGYEMAKDDALPDFYVFATDGTIRMPQNCSGLFDRIGISKNFIFSNTDTSNVLDMSAMFRMCFYVKKIDISCFDTQCVRTMESMFEWCSDAEEICLPERIMADSLRNASKMFLWCTRLAKISIAFSNSTHLADMSDMFHACGKLMRIDFREIDTRNVENLSKMFASCHRLAKCDISMFETKKVKDFSQMFSGCKNLQEVDINFFSVKQMEKIEDMFCTTKIEEVYFQDVSEENRKKLDNVFSALVHITGTEAFGDGLVRAYKIET